jgi:hypothetical protein
VLNVRNYNQKFYALKMSACRGSISVCGVLRLLFLQRGTHEPVYISRISVVKREQGHDDDAHICDDHSGKDCLDISQTFPKGGGHLLECYEFDVTGDDENDEAEALRFRISLFRQNQSQEVQDDGCVLCDIENDMDILPSGTIDSNLECGPGEQLDINIPILSAMISIFSGNTDGEGDISYEDMSYPSGSHISTVSLDDIKVDSKRKYYTSNLY